MKICTIVGARPQFVKAAAVSSKIAAAPGVEEVIVHTGQHYDKAMSEVFFSELGVPRERYNLSAGSGSHAEQTARMLPEIEKVLLDERPSCVLVYGDTNSTLAGALVASKLKIPAAHVEAGMRSFNRRMPEEVNRVVADHLCEFNFCSGETAMENLRREGRGEGAELVGDVMYDCVLMFSPIAARTSSHASTLGLKPRSFVFMTCHRAENTDCPQRLRSIVEAANALSKDVPLLFPAHPRTLKMLKENSLSFASGVKVLPPSGYFESLALQRDAALVLTDSGGVQKEAFFLGTPCVTMRDETEWVETVSLGWNRLAGADADGILSAARGFIAHPPAKCASNPYGDGNAAGRIVDSLKRRFG